MKHSIRCISQISPNCIVSLFAVVLLTHCCLANSQAISSTAGNELRNIRALTSNELRQNLTIVGDILVENGTYLMENINLNLTGIIIVRNDAALVMKNAALLPGAGQVYIGLANRSRFIAENATIVFASDSQGHITVGDDAMTNITDSKLHGSGHIIGRQNSRIHVKCSAFEGPDPVQLLSCGVLTKDNSIARIQDSELDTAQAGGNSSIYVSNSIIRKGGVSAGGNGLIEIENSKVGTSQWLEDNSTIRVQNSTIDSIFFGGGSLIVRDSIVNHWLWVSGNSTAWLTSVSASRVTAMKNATIWLINSHSGAIETSDQGRVYVGWQLPLFGIVTVPYTWVPTLQGITVLATLVLIIALLVFLNRRWKKWQLQKLKQQSQTSLQS